MEDDRSLATGVTNDHKAEVIFTMYVKKQKVPIKYIHVLQTQILNEPHIGG